MDEIKTQVLANDGVLIEVIGSDEGYYTITVGGKPTGVLTQDVEEVEECVETLVAANGGRADLKRVKEWLNVQYGKYASAMPGKGSAEHAVQIRHDGLPSGYITDKELFEWALVGVEQRAAELEQELNTWSLHRLGNEAYVNLRKCYERVLEKRVYLKEVLDGLG